MHVAYIHTSICVCVFVYIYIYTYVHTRIRVICIYMYLYTYTCICIYTYMYIYIYIYIWALHYPPYFWEISVLSWFLTISEAQSHVIYDIVWTPGQLHVTINLVNCMNLVEQKTLGIEPGTSCIRGRALTNWVVHATSLWSSSCSLPCLMVRGFMK